MLTQIDLDSVDVILRNVRVVDVVEGKTSDPQDVLVHDGVIKEIGSVQAPRLVHDIDCEGLTISPGLINCHAHILSPYLSEQKGFLGAWAFRQMKLNFEATLAAGVVCVRDMLSPIKIMNMVKGKTETGEYMGPQVIASGAVLSCKGGYPEFVTPVPFPLSQIIGQPKLNLHSPKKAASMLRDLVASGAEVAKVGYTSFVRDFYTPKRMPVIAPDVLDAICETAHELGIKVAVHHNWTADLPKILSSDIDSLEHVVYDDEISDEMIAIIKEKNIAIVPTLTVSDSMARFEEKLDFLKSDRAKEMFEEQARDHLLYISDTWLNFNNEPYDDVFGIWRANRKHYKVVEDNVRKMYEAGIKFCAGTDLGAVTAFPGEMADELRRMHKCGISVADSLRAGTVYAAELVGRKDTLGVIEPGKHADVMIIEGDPLEDLTALRKVKYVGKSGNWFQTVHPEIPDFWLGHSTMPD